MWCLNLILAQKASDYTRLRAKFYDETLQVHFVEVNERSELSIFDFEDKGGDSYRKRKYNH
ncbi:hypothetical protein CS009_07315 [Streptococcus macedonicus]|uniref:Uncharacterized protein n=2 Tax=Streptococcus TaxID=1301 RepID=A0A2G3P012_STRMC|nr:hypothetical protein CS009_07315 [Streptococcus macedonicus]PHV59109.1 hypothetical protein CS010_00270 [Streptococcus macedonicus]RCW17476.1 hypothetical protein CAC02_02770 [Streptococcus gallolyticus]CCF01687.1 Hypothetical protein SMA_0396 [Streptococcus macedonicus ACA-DC 198]